MHTDGDGGTIGTSWGVSGCTGTIGTGEVSQVVWFIELSRSTSAVDGLGSAWSWDVSGSKGTVGTREVSVFYLFREVSGSTKSIAFFTFDTTFSTNCSSYWHDKSVLHFCKKSIVRARFTRM